MDATKDAPASTGDEDGQVQTRTTGFGPRTSASTLFLENDGRGPLIVVVVSSLEDFTNEADLERIRAEVRSLGVTLRVIAPDSTLSFEVDDRVHRTRTPLGVEAASLETMLREPDRSNGREIAPASRGWRVLRAIAVIDQWSAFRFVRIGATASLRSLRAAMSSTSDLLLRALVAASDELEKLGSRGAGGVSLAERTTLAVIAGMESVLNAA